MEVALTVNYFRQHFIKIFKSTFYKATADSVLLDNKFNPCCSPVRKYCCIY